MEAGLQLTICLSDASCNDTGVPKRGLNKLMEKGEKSVSKELLNIHMKSTFTPLKSGDITDKDRYESLELLMFLKEKRYGSVKGWAYADSWKQRPGSSKEDATSPTVLLEAVLITSVIDAYKERKLAIFNVTRSFLIVYQYETINTPLRGKLAELMVKTLQKFTGNTSQLKMENCTICTATEGAIQVPAQYNAILQKTSGWPRIQRVYHQSILSLRHEKDDRWVVQAPEEKN